MGFRRNGSFSNSILIRRPEYGYRPSPQTVFPFLDLDFTLQSTGSYVIIARSNVSVTGTMFPASSLYTFASTTGQVYEDRGNSRKGWWTFGPYTNDIPDPFDFSSTNGWTLENSAARVAAATTGPDGVRTADQITDGNVASRCSVYHGNGAGGAKIKAHSGWVKDATPTPNESGGALTCNVETSTLEGISFGTGSLWRRWFSWGNTDYIQMILPAGYVPSRGASASDYSKTGSVYVCGNQSVNSMVHDVPLVSGSTKAQTIQINDTTKISTNGEFFVSGSFLTFINGAGYLTGTDSYAFFSTGSDGETSLRYDTASTSWKFKIRGTDRVSLTRVGWMNNLAITFKCWYLPSCGQYGMQLTYNGATLPDVLSATGTLSPSPAFETPTSFWLGSKTGSANHLPAIWQNFRTFSSGTFSVPGRFEPEFLLLGDSISTDLQILNVYTFITTAAVYTPGEAKTRPGIVGLGVSGHTAQSQETTFLASLYKGSSAVTAVIVDVGTNNINQGQSVAATTGSIQSLVNTVKTYNPSAKVILCKIKPNKSYLDSVNAAYFGRLYDVNNWIVSGSCQNVDHICTGSADMLDNGSYDLKQIYNVGDNIHINNLAKYVVGNAYRATLMSASLLP